MSYNISDYKYIQRFFEFELSAQELEAFNERLEKDTHFFQQVQTYRSIDAKIDRDFLGATKESQQVFQAQWQQQLREHTVLQAFRPKKWWLIAASFILALSVGIGYWVAISAAVSYQQLASNNWEKISIDLIERSNTTATSYEALTLANTSYEAQAYKESLSQLQSININSPFYEKGLLLQGQCYFKLQDAEQAIRAFQALIDLENSEKDRAYWYQALAYIHLENIEAAKQNLHFIIAQNYPLANRAKSLLNQL